MWTEGGLIVRHSGELTALDLLTTIRKIFEFPGIETLDYAVADYSAVTEAVLLETDAADIGALLRDLANRHGLLDRPLRWAAVCEDTEMEHLIRVIAQCLGHGVHLKVFTRMEEAFAWAVNLNPWARLAG